MLCISGERIEAGQAVPLRHKSAIRISTYQLYFLLPTDAKPTEHVVVVKTATKNKAKQRPKPSGSSPGPAAKKAKTTASAGAAHADLEQLPTDELLAMMEKAYKSGSWERKDQIIGTTIALRAVVSAAEAPDMQKPVLENPGVERKEILTWIENSEKYGKWSKMMLAKMEQRSY
ncbi:MAG: hypothetical protein SGARI_007134, partial [Bacillariaceae sp.]